MQSVTGSSQRVLSSRVCRYRKLYSRLGLNEDWGGAGVGEGEKSRVVGDFSVAAVGH